jgi:hypothetical protein
MKMEKGHATKRKMICNVQDSNKKIRVSGWEDNSDRWGWRTSWARKRGNVTNRGDRA